MGPQVRVHEQFVDEITFFVAEELSRALVQGICCQKPDGSVTVSCPLVRSENLQQLLHLIVAQKTSNILSKLTVPFMKELLHTGFGAVVMEAPRKPLMLEVQPTGSEQLIDEDAFCIGWLPACAVQLDVNEPSTSKIHICIFNMPGCIIVVDGWKGPGIRLEVGGKRIPRRATGSIFMVPHGTAAVIHTGKQRVLIKPGEGCKPTMQMPEQE